MHQILIVGAGKSATILIESLLQQAKANDLFIHVADVNEDLARAKVMGNERSKAHAIKPGDDQQLEGLITQVQLVISMLPPPFHFNIARICLRHRKHFLNASYLTDEIQGLHEEVKQAGLTFICELGLDPGIDHMSAMEMIDGIKARGGAIHTFRSHCGGLISPESDDNPWHYKISWNPRNIVMAGKDGAKYLTNGESVFVPYADLFDPSQSVDIPGNGTWSWYANRDSLAYISKYGLEGVHDFVRTTLRHPHFSHGWKRIVALGLTNESNAMDTTGMTTRSYFSDHIKLRPNTIWDDELTRSMFSFLGFFDDEPLPVGTFSSADILQWILERKLALSPADRDMIIMLHEIGYTLDGVDHFKTAHLVVKGTDQQHTAMAATVGLPLAIAAVNILNGKIHRPGVSIPLYPEIYNILLQELEKNGITFTYNY